MIDGDGDCFFNSVSHGTGKSGDSLRQLAVAAGKRDEIKYRPYLLHSDSTFQSELHYLSLRGNWNCNTGDLVPLMLSDAMQRPITIISNYKAPLFINPHLTSAPIIVTRHADHYDATAEGESTFRTLLIRVRPP